MFEITIVAVNEKGLIVSRLAMDFMTKILTIAHNRKEQVPQDANYVISNWRSVGDGNERLGDSDISVAFNVQWDRKYLYLIY
jgi:hypothetical protein